MIMAIRRFICRCFGHALDAGQWHRDEHAARGWYRDVVCDFCDHGYVQGVISPYRPLDVL